MFNHTFLAENHALKCPERAYTNSNNNKRLLQPLKWPFFGPLTDDRGRLYSQYVQLNQDRAKSQVPK